MLIIHLSDIHFRKSEIETTQDPNFALRNEILRDAEAFCKRLEAPAAIVITGDIAFAGHVDEYQFALDWLKDLCERCGCGLETVFVCPGNHDVDRKKVDRPIVQSLHKDIKRSSSLALEATITGFLTDPETGRILYEGIEEYNNFAGQFFCSLLPPDRTRAKRDLELNDGSKLRLWGLNSCFASSTADKERDLFVDTASMQIPKEAGVEHLVMMHHPISWIRQGQQLEDHLNDVARIQMFGHEHTNRINMNRDWLRLNASAAHPDRREAGWEPGYNLIEISVVNDGDTRKLKLQSHVRVWQTAPGQFRAKLDRNEKDIFAQEIELDAWQAPAKEKVSSGGGQAELTSEETEDVEERADIMTTLRQVSIKFYSLSFSKKSEIAGRLELLEEEDMLQPDFERFRRVFLRAKDRGKLDDLIAAIEDSTGQ